MVLALYGYLFSRHECIYLKEGQTYLPSGHGGMRAQPAGVSAYHKTTNNPADILF